MIRQLPDAWAKTLPIVAMTANAFEDDRQACIDAGMNDHVAKPVTSVKLYSALLRWLQPDQDAGSKPAATETELG